MRRVVALNFGEPVWVRAELSQVSRSRGHFYLSLVEKGSQTGEVAARATALLWARDHTRLRKKLGPQINALLQSGRQILLQVLPKFSEVHGYALHVEDLDPAFTLGQLELERQATIEYLREKNLLRRNADIPLPAVLQRLAVISSDTAAGLRDYTRHLRGNAYGYAFENQLFVAAMQGERTTAEVTRALTKIKRLKKDFDAVLIVRGGGSRLDLSAFDDRKICEQIAKMPLPVLTGIGHDQDTSVADLTAHRALKTPTAVAQFLLERNAGFEQRLQNDLLRIGQLSRQIGQQQQRYLGELHGQLRFATRLRLERAGEELHRYRSGLQRDVQRQLERAATTLEAEKRLLELLSPEATLARGYALVRQGGKVVQSATAVEPGVPLDIDFGDGRVSR